MLVVWTLAFLWVFDTDSTRNQVMHNKERIGIEPGLSRESTEAQQGLSGDSICRRAMRSVRGLSQDSTRARGGDWD